MHAEKSLSMRICLYLTVKCMSTGKTYDSSGSRLANAVPKRCCVSIQQNSLAFNAKLKSVNQNN